MAGMPSPDGALSVARPVVFTVRSPSGRTMLRMGHRIISVAATLCLVTAAAATQPLLPRCSAGLDGQVSQGGCVCRHDGGGQLTGRPSGWRWACDLLRGPGTVEVVPPAGLPPQGLPPGFGFSQRGNTRAGANPADLGY
jgi:hypothetical protein